jgi:hypothetical protein
MAAGEFGMYIFHSSPEAPQHGGNKKVGGVVCYSCKDTRVGL